jgi:hypothetical protein
METDTQNPMQRVLAFVFVLATAALAVVIGIGWVYLTSGGSDSPTASDEPVRSGSGMEN